MSIEWDDRFSHVYLEVEIARDFCHLTINCITSDYFFMNALLDLKNSVSQHQGCDIEFRGQGAWAGSVFDTCVHATGDESLEIVKDGTVSSLLLEARDVVIIVEKVSRIIDGGSLSHLFFLLSSRIDAMVRVVYWAGIRWVDVVDDWDLTINPLNIISV